MKKIKRWFAWVKADRKRLIGALLILVVIGFGVRYFINKSKNKVTYQTAVAEKGTLTTGVSSSGSISVGNNNPITTSATGTVSAVFVKVGDKVYKGQKIATIILDQDSLQKQAQSWASYLSAKGSLDSANNRYNTLQAAEFKANQTFINDAVARGLATNDPTYIQENALWLAAEADYKNQATSVSQSQASLSSAWYSYQQVSSNVVAPISGIVKNLNIAPGVVIASSGTSSTTTTTFQTIGTITQNTGHIQANVSLSEVDATKVSPGLNVSIAMDAFPDKTFAGKVLMVNTTGSVSSGVTSYPAVIEFDTDLANIYTNMSVTANIITRVIDDVILVPSSAVHTSNGTSTVQVIKGGKQNSVTVEIAGSNNTQTAISSGINEGDTVVTGSTSASTTSTRTTTSVFGSFGGGNRTFGGGGAVGR